LQTGSIISGNGFAAIAFIPLSLYKAIIAMAVNAGSSFQTN